MTFNFDRQATQDLQRCLEGTTQEALRKELSKHLPKPYSKSHFSKMATGKRRVPEAIHRLVTVRLAGGATTFIQVPDACGVLRCVIRSLQERDFAAVVEIVDAVAAGLRATATTAAGRPAVLARLLALKANALRGLDDVGGARRVYQEAAEIAQAGAPELHARYRLSEMSWGSELATRRYKTGEIVEKIYRAELQDVLKAAIAVKTRDPKDAELRLRVILRIASLLDDEKTFAHYLEVARKHATFGATPEERDAALRRWMSPGQDPDKDFKNASYFNVTKELQPMNRRKKEKS